MMVMNKKKMLHQEIEKLQDKLDKLIEKEGVFNQTSLQLSQRLDKLIVEYLQLKKK